MIHILIGTPCYAGLCSAEYTMCLLSTKEYLTSKNIKMSVAFLINESLIPRGRNTIVAQFLENKQYTHLLFIDADIKWNPIDVYRLIVQDRPVIGGIYPKKSYNFKKLQNENILEKIASSPLTSETIDYIKANLMDYVVNYDDSNSFINGFISVNYIGTGFLMIQRHVFEKLIDAFPEDKYNDDINILTESQNKYLYAFFNCEIHGPNKRYLSEDYNFCKKWRSLNQEIYADTLIRLTHIGTHAFDGNVLSTLNIGNLPGVPEEVSKIYQRLQNNNNQLTEENVKESIDTFINQIPEYVDSPFHGKGIVICSGSKYLHSSTFALKFLRNSLKCNLPIEWFYYPGEMTPESIETCVKEIGNITFICTDARKFDVIPPAKSIKSYEIKPFALLASTFEEIILIDADNIPLQNLEILFDEYIYKTHGSLFWLDYWEHSNTKLHSLLNITPHVKTSQESGQILINKKMCWKELNLSWFLNYHSSFFYKYSMGDKDLYQIAWQYIGARKFITNNYKPQSIGRIENNIYHGNTMLQLDIYGNPLFAHMTLNKEMDLNLWEVMTWGVQDWVIHSDTHKVCIDETEPMCKIKPLNSILQTIKNKFRLKK